MVERDDRIYIPDTDDSDDTDDERMLNSKFDMLVEVSQVERLIALNIVGIGRVVLTPLDTFTLIKELSKCLIALEQDVEYEYPRKRT